MAATLLYKKFLQGIGLIPKASTTNVALGDLEALTDNRLHFFGASNDSVTTDAVSTTLTNKALSDSTTSIVDVGDATKKILFDAGGTTNTTTTITGAQTGNRVLTLPDATDTLTANAATQTLTNKTIAAGSNTITGLINANLSGSAAITNANLATMASNTVKANVTGGAAVPTDVSAVTTSTANSFVIRDTNKAISGGNFLSDYTTTATAAGTTTLTVASTYQQFFTGSTTQTLVLPVASTLVLGQSFFIVNTSSGIVTVQSSGANTIQAMAGNSELEVTCILTSGTSAASWQAFYTPAISGTVPIANGGTGQISKTAAFDALQPMTTGGDIIYGGASGTGTRLANGSSGQFLKSNGGTTAPSWANPSINLLTPNIQSLLSGTAATYGLSYWFTCTSANATVGATYTNNTQTFTVSRTIAAGTLLLCTSTGAPTGSGTLTKATGTGDATITFSAFNAPIYLRVRAVGGGGGGSGGGGSSPGTGGTGGTTTFGTSMISCVGGSSSAQGTTATSGGTASLGTGPIGFSAQGAPAGGISQAGSTGSQQGGNGGTSPFGGGGGGSWSTSTASAGATNSGSGGGGGGCNSTTVSGQGGSSGGFVDAFIYSPTATYTYTIGAGGTAGAAGGGGSGGAGGTGVIYVEEFFQ